MTTTEEQPVETTARKPRAIVLVAAGIGIVLLFGAVSRLRSDSTPQAVTNTYVRSQPGPQPLFDVPVAFGAGLHIENGKLAGGTGDAAAQAALLAASTMELLRKDLNGDASSSSSSTSRFKVRIRASSSCSPSSRRTGSSSKGGARWRSAGPTWRKPRSPVRFVCGRPRRTVRARSTGSRPSRASTTRPDGANSAPRRPRRRPRPTGLTSPVRPNEPPPSLTFTAAPSRPGA